MGINAVIPAAIASTRQQKTAPPPPAESSRMVWDNPHPAGPSAGRRTSYGATYYTASPTSPTARGKRPDPEGEAENGGGGGDIAFTVNNGEVVEEGYYEEESDDGLEPGLDFTWKYMSRLYLLVPVITLLFLAGLIMIITFAWPPNKREQKHGQTYPHPFLWKPFLTGIFASCTIQTIRVPVWVFISWFNVNPTFTAYFSTTLHSILHELARMSTLPLTIPSPTSGFHSSYYLGLGWGVAEAAWGIVQGYEQLALYEDIMKPEKEDSSGSAEYMDSQFTAKIENVNGNGNGSPHSPELEGGLGSAMTFREDEESLLDRQREDEAELERKVEILERMRARRDLEEVLGVPYPSIPFPLHLLWRLDTLLLNLGLTLILSAFYFNPVPIYRHDIPHHDQSSKHPILTPHAQSSQYLWLVWALVAVLHVCVSLVWKVVGRVGIGAVTWGGLIVALGTVFAGLGGWGGLV